MFYLIVIRKLQSRRSAHIHRPRWRDRGLARDRKYRVRRTFRGYFGSTLPFAHAHYVFSGTACVTRKKKQNPTKVPPPRDIFLPFPLLSPFLIPPPPPFLSIFCFFHTPSQWVQLQTAALSSSLPSLSVRVTPIRLRELYP